MDRELSFPQRSIVFKPPNRDETYLHSVRTSDEQAGERIILKLLVTFMPLVICSRCRRDIAGGTDQLCQNSFQSLPPINRVRNSSDERSENIMDYFGN